MTAAAWLHDIGYAPAVDDTGFHPLDGARYLRDVEQATGCAAWSPTTPAPSSKPPNAASPPSWPASSSPPAATCPTR